MNFHPPHPWLTTEESALIALRLQGKSYEDIAQVIKRTPKAIKERANRLRLNPPRVFPKTEPRPIFCISKDELEAYYALGWRVTSFCDHSCVLEWPHAGTPWFPSGGAS